MSLSRRYVCIASSASASGAVQPCGVDLDGCLAPPADHFGTGGEYEDRADGDLLERVVDAEDVQAVLDDGDEQHTEQRALHRAHPTEDARATQDHRRGGEQSEAGSDGRLDGLEEGGEQ